MKKLFVIVWLMLMTILLSSWFIQGFDISIGNVVAGGLVSTPLAICVAFLLHGLFGIGMDKENKA